MPYHDCPTCKELSLEFINCYDNPDNGYAFNLYLCLDCGTVVKDDVWKNAGKTIINKDGTIVKQPKE